MIRSQHKRLTRLTPARPHLVVRLPSHTTTTASRRPYIRLPLGLVLAIAMLFEYVIRPLLRPIKELTTDFTVFRVRLVTRQRAFSCAKARRVLGYAPATPLAEGVRRTVAHFAHLRADADANAAAPGGGGGGGDSKKGR